MNFQAFLHDELTRCAEACPSWAETIRDCAGRFSDQAHGDFPRWRQALEQLDPHEDPEPALRALMPWRKGPWRFGAVHIETEWRSDWKWARLQPHLPDLAGRRVLDVGCGNGYFGWQLLGAGALAVIGIDPTLLYCMQHLAAIRLQGTASNWVLPLTLEDSPGHAGFDLVLSMGVIYHRRDPRAHITQLFGRCAPGATVVVESLVVEGVEPLHPQGRYARMRNVHTIPDVPSLRRWLLEAGFVDAVCVDETPTRLEEQRTTDWMPFESLREALDPGDPARTVEGHPAPRRAIVIARR